MLDINRIKSDFAYALRKRCSENRCTLKLQGLGNLVILNGEEIRSDRKMCDCIIFIANGSVIIGIVELKSKTTHTSEIIKKLTNSSEIALSILRRNTDGRVEPEFYHLVLAKSWDASELRKMERHRIAIRGTGKRYEILHGRCGISFSDNILV